MSYLARRSEMPVTSTGATIFHANLSKPRRPLDTLDLEELPNSRERAGGLLSKSNKCLGGVL